MKDVAGVYTSGSLILELKEDGTYIMSPGSQPQGAPTGSMMGVYKVSGNTVGLCDDNPDGEPISEFKIKNGELINTGSGNSFVKQQNSQ